MAERTKGSALLASEQGLSIVEALEPAGNRLLSWFNRRGWRFGLVAIPYVWLLLFFLAPFAIILAISVGESVIAVPPFRWGENWPMAIRVSFGNFSYLFEDDTYWFGYVNSVRIAGIATVLCLLLGYPMAYGIARASGAWRNILLLLIILPFWTSFLLRIYAWMGLLSTNGVINQILQALYIIDSPLQMMNTNFAVYIGIVYSYLPFMILPLYANLERLDHTLNEAAMDLGSRPFRVFIDVTLPLSVPGIVAGALLVFIPATGEYVIPALLGRADNPMIGRVLFDEFFINRDWPLACAVAVILLLVLVVPIMLFNNFQAKSGEKAA
ncbi:MAG: ABC transporter permease [Dongiaceae bacterium]